MVAGTTANLCLAGLVAAVRVTSLLSMDMLRNTFVTTVARFTQLHAPASMALKHAQAFRALLVIADENGNHLGVCRQAAASCGATGSWIGPETNVQCWVFCHHASAQ